MADMAADARGGLSWLTCLLRESDSVLVLNDFPHCVKSRFPS